MNECFICHQKFKPQKTMISSRNQHIKTKHHKDLFEINNFYNKLNKNILLTIPDYINNQQLTKIYVFEPHKGDNTKADKKMIEEIKSNFERPRKMMEEIKTNFIEREKRKINDILIEERPRMFTEMMEEIKTKFIEREKRAEAEFQKNIEKIKEKQKEKSKILFGNELLALEKKRKDDKIEEIRRYMEIQNEIQINLEKAEQECREYFGRNMAYILRHY